MPATVPHTIAQDTSHQTCVSRISLIIWLAFWRAYMKVTESEITITMENKLYGIRREFFKFDNSNIYFIYIFLRDLPVAFPGHLSVSVTCVLIPWVVFRLRLVCTAFQPAHSGGCLERGSPRSAWSPWEHCLGYFYVQWGSSSELISLQDTK